MLPTRLMLLFLSSAGVRRAAVANGPALAAAFVTRAPSARAPSTSAAAALARASTARFMSTDAVAGEKTEEEKAAIKAAREARK